MFRFNKHFACVLLIFAGEVFAKVTPPKPSLMDVITIEQQDVLAPDIEIDWNILVNIAVPFTDETAEFNWDNLLNHGFTTAERAEFTLDDDTENTEEDEYLSDHDEVTDDDDDSRTFEDGETESDDSDISLPASPRLLVPEVTGLLRNYRHALPLSPLQRASLGLTLRATPVYTQLENPAPSTVTANLLDNLESLCED